jgi:hypothetical protein
MRRSRGRGKSQPRKLTSTGNRGRWAGAVQSVDGQSQDAPSGLGNVLFKRTTCEGFALRLKLTGLLVSSPDESPKQRTRNILSAVRLVFGSMAYVPKRFADNGDGPTRIPRTLIGNAP